MKVPEYFDAQLAICSTALIITSRYEECLLGTNLCGRANCQLPPNEHKSEHLVVCISNVRYTT